MTETFGPTASIRPVPHPADNMPTSGWARRHWRLLVLIIILIGFIAGGLSYWYIDHHKRNVNDVTVIENMVERHYLLPTDETPVLATVTDPTKLTTPFLQQAHDGDKLLIYQKNQLAIIYRPSIDRIIAVGPVTIDNPPKSAQ